MYSNSTPDLPVETPPNPDKHCIPLTEKTHAEQQLASKVRTYDLHPPAKKAPWGTDKMIDGPPGIIPTARTNDELRIAS